MGSVLNQRSENGAVSDHSSIGPTWSGSCLAHYPIGSRILKRETHPRKDDDRAMFPLGGKLSINPYLYIKFHNTYLVIKQNNKIIIQLA